MKLDKLITNKLNDVLLKNSKGNYNFYSVHSKHFLNWCERNQLVTTSDFTEEQLIRYINFNKETCSNTTINKRVGILKRAYKHSNVEFLFLANLTKLKEKKKVIEIIDETTHKEILEYVKSDSTVNSLMYRTLIYLLADTGARINEVMNIEKNNISLKNNEILLTTTKTDVDRYVYYLNDTKDYIKETLEQKNPTSFLLYNFDKERPINYDDVRFFFRKLKDDLEIPKLHPHLFRHTFATSWLENGADLFSVQNVLGHTNAKTTELYVHVSKKHIKKSYLNKHTR